ncbi:MAG: hypothetical protein ACK5NE_08580 [Brachymonas sp.]
MTYPRNERQAHAELLRASQTRRQSHDWDGSRKSFWARLAEFWREYRHNRKHSSVARSARIAYGIAFKGLPF